MSDVPWTFDPGFGTAQVGDTVPMPSTVNNWEFIAKLVKADPDKHVYGVYLFGVHVGGIIAKLENGSITWEAV